MGKRAVRLLAYKDRLMEVPDGPDWDAMYYGGRDDVLHKQKPEWKATYEACKAIIAKREHVSTVERGPRA
jgi:hypothetical protein